MPMISIQGGRNVNQLTYVHELFSELAKYAASGRLGLLDWEHRDPWDRLLAAQARLQDCTLVSADAVFDVLGLARLW